jgi:2-dehydro-3-deoxyglucarate aldolase
MNRLERTREIRDALAAGTPSIGSWMQLPDGSVAEIMGAAGYDWIAVDMEHGSISLHQLPDLFRAIEAGGALPLVRLAEGTAKECKQALDAGAGGVIVPMVESAAQLVAIRDQCRWPPAGKRGVGFSRANHFGRRFDTYVAEAQSPLLVAMIEHTRAVDDLADILAVDGLDAILIGPYDLSASMGLTAEFESADFVMALNRIRQLAAERRVPCGVHVVMPDAAELAARVGEGFRFIAFSIDAVFLHVAASRPDLTAKPAR